MSRSIEQAHWSETETIQQLVSATYINQEPGFQINGVRTLEQLEFVLGELILAAPTAYYGSTSFTNASPYGGTLEGRAITWTELERRSGPHIDTNYRGLAVHHNLSHTIPVELGVQRRPLTLNDSLSASVTRSMATNRRKGKTVPGRLTVFSEGGLPSLKKTVHLFDRRETKGPIQWARYAQAEKDTDQAHNTITVARRAFEQLDKYL